MDCSVRSSRNREGGQAETSRSKPRDGAETFPTLGRSRVTDFALQRVFGYRRSKKVDGTSGLGSKADRRAGSSWRDDRKMSSTARSSSVQCSRSSDTDETGRGPERQPILSRADADGRTCKAQHESLGVFY